MRPPVNVAAPERKARRLKGFVEEVIQMEIYLFTGAAGAAGVRAVRRVREERRVLPDDRYEELNADRSNDC